MRRAHRHEQRQRQRLMTTMMLLAVAYRAPRSSSHVISITIETPGVDQDGHAEHMRRRRQQTVNRGSELSSAVR
jgi:hypothetical protein